MIRTIQIDGFKSIASQTLELGRVNCFIGANGVGKSNILEAIGVLGAAASGRVDDESLQRRGVRAGMPRLYKAAFPAPPHPAAHHAQCRQRCRGNLPDRPAEPAGESRARLVVQDGISVRRGPGNSRSPSGSETRACTCIPLAL